MTAKTLNVLDARDTVRGASQAAAILDEGGLVIFPTETVYGVAARADRPDALRKLHQIKDRPTGKPFSVHIARRADAEQFVPDVGVLARRLMRKTWPGPLTLILSTPDPNAAPAVANLDADVVTALYHERSIGLRCPDHVAALEMLKMAGGPVVAASANRAGRTPPSTVEAALEALGDDVDLALDGGPAKYNRASTVVRVNGDRFEILRDGVYDARMLNGFAVQTIVFVCTGNTCRSPMAVALAELQIARRLGCEPGELRDRNVRILSAGTFASSGHGAADHACTVIRRMGSDLSSHRSQRLTVEMLNQADYIFAMTEAHRDDVTALVPSTADRVKLLLAGEDISDPIGGTEESYAQCAEVLDRAIQTRLTEIEL